jgi:hypothetical protein
MLRKVSRQGLCAQKQKFQVPDFKLDRGLMQTHTAAVNAAIAPTGATLLSMAECICYALLRSLLN